MDKKLFLAATMAALTGCERDRGGPPRIRVESARVMVSPSGAGAVYFAVENTGGGDRLLAAHTEEARNIELHEIIDDGDLVRMVPRPEGFAVPAKGRLELAPGGKHLMLFGLRPGANDLELTLDFQRAGAVRVKAALQSMAQ